MRACEANKMHETHRLSVKVGSSAATLCRHRACFGESLHINDVACTAASSMYDIVVFVVLF